MSDPMPPPPPPPAYPPPAPTSGGPASSNRTVMLVLSYLGILALIPFLTEKNDREVQWHAKHGLVLLGAEIALWIVLGILAQISDCLAGMLMIAVWLGLLALHIFLIVKAVNGERFKLPVLSDFVDKF